MTFVFFKKHPNKRKNPRTIRQSFWQGFYLESRGGNRNIGWYPELVFKSVVFSNSTNLALVILNNSVLKIYFVKQIQTSLHLLGRQNPQFNQFSIEKKITRRKEYQKP